MNKRKRLNCQYCKSFYCYDRTKLEQHELAHAIMADSWECSLCSSMFLSDLDYETHVRSLTHQLALQQRRMKSYFHMDVEESNNSSENNTNGSTEEEPSKVEFDILDEDTFESDDSALDDLDMLDEILNVETESSHVPLQPEAVPNQPRSKPVPVELFHPYSSWPMMYLRQWKLSEGKLLSQNSFNTLLQLLFKLVKDFGNQPYLWPRNFKQIQQREKEHLTKQAKIVNLKVGKLVMLPVEHVVGLMFRNKQIFENLHYTYEKSDTVGPFWTGQQWYDTQQQMESTTPGAKLFPLIAYSDKSRVLRTRKGHILHPVVVTPAGVPREIWKQHHNKYTIGYISATASLEDAISKIVDEISVLEEGKIFYDPEGHGHFLVTTILVWLGDHEELNTLSFIYAKACRICYKTWDDETGDWFYRSKQEALFNLKQMIDWHDTPRCKNKAFDQSKKLQQHIAEPSLTRLQYFDVYQQTPPCPGHSENQGRTLRHLFELFQNYDAKILQVIDVRLSQIPRFPGLILPNNPDRISMSTLIKDGVRLLSSELQSIRSVILFILIDLLSRDHLLCLKYHVVYAAGYYKKSWTKEERLHWDAVRDEFLDRFEKLFANQIDFNIFPKGHDPCHDDWTVNRFGSFLNLDEMNMEGVHQIAKQLTAAINGQDVEWQLLNKQDELQQLSSEFSHHFELYILYLKPKKSRSWQLQGNKKGFEDWTTPTHAWKGKLLNSVLQSCRGWNLNLEDLSRMPVYSRLFVESCDVILKALPHGDIYDTVLIANDDTPWISVHEFFTVSNPQTHQKEEWLCGSVMDFEDPNEPIDYFTGCPRVQYTVDKFIMVPASDVLQLVHLVEDPRKKCKGTFWINWWITFGPNTYPEHHRRAMQLKHVYVQ